MPLEVLLSFNGCGGIRMDREGLLKSGFDMIILLNALFLIIWILLSIFPGAYAFYVGDLVEGLLLVFVNSWFGCFCVTLVLGLLLREMLKREETRSVQEATEG